MPLLQMIKFKVQKGEMVCLYLKSSFSSLQIACIESQLEDILDISYFYFPLYSIFFPLRL